MFNRVSVSIFVLTAGSYVASIDGGEPLIRWQLETGLNWTISSVAGESYRVDVSGPFLASVPFFTLFVVVLNARIVLFLVRLT